MSCFSVKKSRQLSIGFVAQRLEQGTHKPKVVGSNPTRANFGEMAEWSKAADC